MQSSGLHIDVKSAIDRSLKPLGLYISLKQKQTEAICTFASEDNDVFDALPTVYRKLFCYAFLMVVFNALR